MIHSPFNIVLQANQITEECKMVRKHIKYLLGLSMVALMSLPLTGCGGGSEQITVITREDGSGTRGAFVEVVDITIGGNDGITEEAVVQPETGAMLTAVSTNPMAIGYASTGRALTDDRVKVLSVNGVFPTVENMLNGTYAIQRPFIIGYNTAAGLSPLAQDFIDFIFSEQGQEVVSRRGYVPFVPTGAPTYVPRGLTGTIVVNGSSSVYSLMGHLREAYIALQPNVDNVRVDIHGAGTGVGINAVRENIADIAMSSRDLRESELAFMTPLTIGIDGIAVIVHPNNDVDNLTLEQVRNIFLGEIEEWDDIH